MSVAAMRLLATTRLFVDILPYLSSGAAADAIVVGGGDDDGYSSGADSDSDAALSKSQLKLQYNTVRSYISAIQNLYDEQKSCGINPALWP